jgi:hypothetical protein
MEKAVQSRAVATLVLPMPLPNQEHRVDCLESHGLCRKRREPAESELREPSKVACSRFTTSFTFSAIHHPFYNVKRTSCFYGRSSPSRTVVEGSYTPLSRFLLHSAHFTLEPSFRTSKAPLHGSPGRLETGHSSYPISVQYPGEEALEPPGRACQTWHTFPYLWRVGILESIHSNC